MLSKPLFISSSLCPVRLVQLLEPAACTPTPRPFPTGFPLLEVLLQLLPPALYNFFENVTHFSGTEVNQPLEQDLFLPMIYLQGRSAQGSPGGKLNCNWECLCTHTCEKILSQLTRLQKKCQKTLLGWSRWPVLRANAYSGFLGLVTCLRAAQWVFVSIPVLPVTSWANSLTPLNLSLRLGEMKVTIATA